MRPGEGELRRCRVVELRPLPLRRAVADRAVLREARRDVIRIRRAVVVGEVATVAGGRRALVDVVLVALGALDRSMRPGEGGLRRRRVVELGALPLCRRMADGAVLREARSHVVWIRSLVEVRQVATVAGGRRTGVLAVNVARRALSVAVRAGERESGLGMVELGSLPLHSRMTDRAVFGEARRGVAGIGRLVEVRQMAAFARGRRSPEHIVLMALRTLDRSVRSG